MLARLFKKLKCFTTTTTTPVVPFMNSHTTSIMAPQAIISSPLHEEKIMIEISGNTVESPKNSPPSLATPDFFEPNQNQKRNHRSRISTSPHIRKYQVHSSNRAYTFINAKCIANACNNLSLAKNTENHTLIAKAKETLEILLRQKINSLAEYKEKNIEEQLVTLRNIGESHPEVLQERIQAKIHELITDDNYESSFFTILYKLDSEITIKTLHALPIDNHNFHAINGIKNKLELMHSPFRLK